MQSYLNIASPEAYGYSKPTAWFEYFRPETRKHYINHISMLATNAILEWDSLKDNTPAKLHKVVLSDTQCNES